MAVLFDKNSKKLITSQDGRDFCRHSHTITFMHTLQWQTHDLTRPLKQVGFADRDKAFSRKRLRVVFKAGRYTIATHVFKDYCEAHCRDKIQSAQLYNFSLFILFWLKMAMFIILCVFLPGPCWMFSTNAIASQFPTRSAREEEGENAGRICFGVISTDSNLHPYNTALLFF